MRRSTTLNPPTDGDDPHRMTDECPPVLDSARWDDLDWRDKLGEWDTFEDEVRTDS